MTVSNNASPLQMGVLRASFEIACYCVLWPLARVAASLVLLFCIVARAHLRAGGFSSASAVACVSASTTPSADAINRRPSMATLSLVKADARL
jgi:hypothetical protein